MATLDHPTVADLVQLLQGFHPNTPVRMLDPDTGWTVTKLLVLTGQPPRPEILWLTGEYGDMTKTVE